MKLLMVGAAVIALILAGLVTPLVLWHTEPARPAIAQPTPLPEASPLYRPPTFLEQTDAPQARSSEPPSPSPSPEISFSDQQTQAAYTAWKERKAELESVTPPAVSPSADARMIAGQINSYVDEMGRRAQAYRAAQEALRPHLTQEQAQKLQIK